MEEKIGQTEQKHEARVKMVEDAAEAKIQALREEMRADRAKLEALEMKAEAKRNKRKERKARKKAEEETEPALRREPEETPTTAGV